MHGVFHVSMLKKYVTDPTHVLRYETLEVSENVTTPERPVRIFGVRNERTTE